MNPATRMFVDDETFDEWLPDSVETKMRHVRTPSAWPGNPPVGTPLPLPPGFGDGMDAVTSPSPKPRSRNGASGSSSARKPFKKASTSRKKPLAAKPVHTDYMRQGMHEATIEERREAKVPATATDVYVPDDPSKSQYRFIAFSPQGKPMHPRTNWYALQQNLKKYARNKSMAADIDAFDEKLKAGYETDETLAALWMIRVTGMRNSKNKTLTPKEKRENTQHLKMAKQSPTFDPDNYKPLHYIAYGASNLEARHVTINKDSVRFRFRGKKFVAIDFTVKDPDLVKAMQKWTEGKSGHDQVFPNTNSDQNLEVVKESFGDDAIVHDLRTLKATTMALELIGEYKGVPPDPKAYIKMRKEVATKVSYLLGNNPDEALKSYIDPMVFDSWRKPEWGDIKGDFVLTPPEGT